MISRTILYRPRWLGALLACTTLFWAVAAVGQEERPQINPGERKASRKKDAGPRAVGVLQLTSNGKATLVPVAILVYGRFYDATAYKADPVPMSLESGTVYEGERAGNSLGLFTVSSALHSNAANVQSPWIGTGAWLPTGTEGAQKGIKAEAAPLGIDAADAPPRLSKTPSTQKEAPPESKQSPPTGSTPPPAPSGDEPPRLSKPPSSSDGAQSGSGQSGSSVPKTPSDSKGGDAKPGEKGTSDAKTQDGVKVPASDSGASEGNRPKLRRGKPAESFGEEEVPGYGKFGTTSKGDAGKIVAAAAAQGPVQLLPAISDAGGPEPRPYTFVWLKGEEGDRRQQMMALAKEQLRAYVDAKGKAKIPAAPKTSKTAAKKPFEPSFGNLQMIGYDLWNNNVPVIVFSAEAHMPPPAGSTQTAAEADLTYSVLVVTYPDIYGNLRKIYSSVTDRFHLDMTPKLDLVDAVDADGDGRGELLFRETSDAGNGWAIYRATTDKLWKVFDSLNQ